MRLQFGFLGFTLAIPALQLAGGMLGDVLQEVVGFTATFVPLWAGFVVLGQPEQRWETAHIERRWDVVGGGVHLYDGNLLILQFGGQLIVGRSQLLAVAAPRSVELNQRIDAIVHDNFLEVLANGNLDGGIVAFGNRFRLDVGLQGSLFQISGEGL